MESGQYQKATGAVPEWWANEPPLRRGDEFYLTAFSELSSCRAFGTTIGPIPWNRILEYGAWKQLDRGMMELFVYVIREMDEAYIKDLHEKQRDRESRQQRNLRKQESRQR